MHTLFSFTPFGIHKDRAVTISVNMMVDILNNSLSEDNTRWHRDTLLYVRNNMSNWVNTHSEANYLYFVFGRFQSNLILQATTIALKKVHYTSDQAFRDKMTEVWKKHYLAKTSPLN